MLGDAQQRFSVAAQRGGQELEAASSHEVEPDTPHHHELRSTSYIAQRRRLLHAAQLLLGFLLIVAAGTWLFVDMEDLHQTSRHAQTRYLLPDGSLVSHRLADYDTSASNTKYSSSSGEDQQKVSNFGLSHFDGDLEESLLQSSAKKRWVDVLEPITTQAITADPPFVNKTIKVVLLTPSCCDLRQLSERQLLVCHRAIMEECPALGAAECFHKAANASACRRQRGENRNPRISFTQALFRLVPFLEELGWSAIEIHRSFLNSDEQKASCALSEKEKEAAKKALLGAKLVLAELAELPELAKIAPEAAFVGIEPSLTATLPRELPELQFLMSSKVRAVWKAQILNHPSHQNGPLLGGASHLALLPGAAHAIGYEPLREPTLPLELILRVRPLLSHAFRFRHPLDSGGEIEHVRFAGAFLQNFSYWKPPPFSRRAINVAFLSRPYFGEIARGQSAGLHEILASHKHALVNKLQSAQLRMPGLKFLIQDRGFSKYEDYLRQLQDIMVLVSPYTSAEWSELDFEAVLCGCLLVKVNPADYILYPDVLRPDKHVLSTPADFRGLGQVLEQAFEDPEHAERMAKRATMLLLEFSDMRRYAGNVDDQLTEIARELQPPQEGQAGFKGLTEAERVPVFGA